MGLSFIIIVYLFIFCNFYILSTSDNHISNTSILNLKVWYCTYFIINSSSSLETQVIRLLHENGHVLIFENGSVFDFKSKRNLNEKNVEDLVVPTDSIVVGTYLYFP